MTTASEILVAGNYCHDLLRRGDAPALRRLGGSSAYIASILGAQGAPFRVVAKVGPDFAYHSEVRAHPPLVAHASRTTEFQINYEAAERGAADRTERLNAICEPLRARELGTRRAEVGVACGVACEIQPDTLEALRGLSRIVVADAQALIRARAADGRVVNLPFDQTPFASRLDLIDYLKMSAQESRHFNLERVRASTNVIITLGKDGCRLLAKGGVSATHIPAFPVEEIDPTGAGDSFLAGLSVGLARARPIIDCLRIGAHCGALAVAQVGVPRIAALDLFR